MLSRASPKSLANLGSSKQNIKSPSQNSPRPSNIKAPAIQSVQQPIATSRLGKQTINHPKQLKKGYNIEPFLIRTQQFQKQKAIKLGEQQRRKLYAQATLQPKKNIIRKKEAVNNDVGSYEHGLQKSKSYKQMYYKRHGKEPPSSKQKYKKIPKNYEQLLRESVSRFNSKFTDKGHEVNKETKRQKLQDIEQKIKYLRQKLKLQDSILQQQSLQISRISYEQEMKSDKNHSQLLQKVINQIQTIDDTQQNLILSSFKKPEAISDAILLEQLKQQQILDHIQQNENREKQTSKENDQIVNESQRHETLTKKDQQDYYYIIQQNLKNKKNDQIQDNHQQKDQNFIQPVFVNNQQVFFTCNPIEDRVQLNQSEEQIKLVEDPQENKVKAHTFEENTNFGCVKLQIYTLPLKKLQAVQIEVQPPNTQQSIQPTPIKIQQDERISAPIEQQVEKILPSFEPIEIQTPTIIIQKQKVAKIQLEQISIPIFQNADQQIIGQQQNSEANIQIIRQSFFDIEGNFIDNVQVQSLDFGLCRFLCAENEKDEEKTIRQS